MIRTLSAIAFLLSTLLVPAQAATVVRGQNEKLSTSPLTGCYNKKSELCTSPHDGTSCTEQFQDTLNVEKNDLGYLVQLHSTQASQHVCYFSFQMIASGGVLINDTPLGRLTLQLMDDTLSISSNGIDPTALGLGICGAHADIDNLIFSVSDRSEKACPTHD